MTLKKYLNFGIATAIILALIIGVSITFLFSTISNLKQTLTEQNEIALTVNDLEDMSSYLKNEARLYSYTGDSKHLDNYNARVALQLFPKAEEQFKQFGVPADITAYLSQINNASFNCG